jgi:hypothetical protein
LNAPRHMEQSGKPDEGSQRLRPALSGGQLRGALHRIEEGAGLSGTDRVVIWDDGTVSGAQDNPLGNIYDEI